MRKKNCNQCKYFEDCWGGEPSPEHFKGLTKRQERKFNNENQDIRYCKGFRHSKSQSTWWRKYIKAFEGIL